MGIKMSSEFIEGEKFSQLSKMDRELTYLKNQVYQYAMKFDSACESLLNGNLNEKDLTCLVQQIHFDAGVLKGLSK